jgi:hypothetical protein
MSNDGEQRQVKQVSATAPGARGGALLPSAPAPAIVSAHGGDVGKLDALLAIVPLPESDYDAELVSKVALEPRA